MTYKRKNDPEKDLESRNYHIIRHEFEEQEEKERWLKKFVQEHRDEYCVIYCMKDYWDYVYEKISKIFPDQTALFIPKSKMSKSEERQILSGERRILITTSKLPKKIAQLDIKFAIHFGLPISITKYYQQIAQAAPGASCILLFCASDFYNNKECLKLKRDKFEHFNYSAALMELDEMDGYAYVDSH